MIGRVIGKYRIVAQIGRGGMGTVYTALDETLGRQVAIKVLNGDVIEAESIERFRREALTLARLNHPRIAAIHELTRDDHDLLMVMELVNGETCERLVERVGPLPVPQAVRICTQVLEALQYAHRAGVVHRDLKPANIIVTPTGDVKVMDFGIARVQGSEHLTTHGFMVGTPAYMPPEQVRGEEVDPRMDLYSLSVVLYRLLTRRLPFQGDTAVSMIHSQLHNPPSPARQFRADLPEWLEAVLARGLSKAPEDRYQSAAEFRAVLDQGLAGRTRSRPVPTLEETMVAPLIAPSPAIGPSRSAAPGTVTLRTPHLATAAALIGAFAIAALALAFIVARRAPAVVSPATASGPAASAPDAAPGTSSPPPGAAPLTTGAPADSTTARTAPGGGAADSSTTPGGTSGNGASGAADRGGYAASRDRSGPSGRAAPRAGSRAPESARRKTAANLPTERFGDVRLLMVEGSNSEEVNAGLSLTGTRIEVHVPDGGPILRSIPYSAVAAATYVRGRHPHGQTTAGLAQVPDDIGSGGFLGASRHWLSLQTPGEFLVLRLEDRNVIRVMMQIEERSGTKVVRDP
jgi:serine/threonine-protein kinase